MTILAGFADISLWQLALVAGVALFASLIGGVSGYGTGALMPLVLVPLVGRRAGGADHRDLGDVQQCRAGSRRFSNTSTCAARRSCCLLRVPTCVLGAWGYTRLTSAGAALVIGAMLIAERAAAAAC